MLKQRLIVFKGRDGEYFGVFAGPYQQRKILGQVIFSVDGEIDLDSPGSGFESLKEKALEIATKKGISKIVNLNAP